MLNTRTIEQLSVIAAHWGRKKTRTLFIQLIEHGSVEFAGPFSVYPKLQTFTTQEFGELWARFTLYVRPKYGNTFEFWIDVPVNRLGHGSQIDDFVNKVLYTIAIILSERWCSYQDPCDGWEVAEVQEHLRMT